MTASHETQTPYETPEMIAQAFDTARREVVAMTNDPGFHDRCASQDPAVDPYDDIDTSAYWTTFADFAYETIEQEKSDTGPSLLQDTKQLLAETPRYLFAQTKLEAEGTTMSREEKYYAKNVASYYNQMLRSFAYSHPEANVADVKKGLESMVNISIEDDMIRQSAAREVYATIHGAQHEIAFGQILSYTGKKFYAADTEQDLRGMDYIVAVSDQQLVGVDVKASDRLVVAGGKSTYPFAVRDTNKIIVHSLTADTEFHGKFFTSEQTASSKAEYLNAMLTQAAKAAA